MTCSKHQRIIDDIGDLDRLPPESARHVNDCHSCAEFAHDLVALRVLLKEQGRVNAPADFDTRLSRRIREVRSPAASTGLFEWFVVPQRMLASAAAFALVAAGAFVVATYKPGSPAHDQLQIATNQSVPPSSAAVENPGAAAIEFPSNATNSTGPSLGNIATSSSGTRFGTRRLQTVARNVNRGDAVLLVQDSAGARLVNVPRILVGAERLVPLPESESSIAALDDRMAF